MRILHENHNRQHSLVAIHFPSVETKSLIRRIFTVSNAKIAFLASIWLLTIVIFIIKPENILTFYHLDVPSKYDKIFRINGNYENPRLDVHMKGAFSEVHTNSTKSLKLYAAIETDGKMKRVSKDFTFHLIEEKYFETSEPVSVSAIIMLSSYLTNQTSKLVLVLNTNYDVTFVLSLAYESKPFSIAVGIGIGGVILLGLYFFFIFEIIDRTFAALIASNLCVAALALFNERPALEEIIQWIDMNTLMLLFGMMILVNFTSQTGCFDYMAVLVFKEGMSPVFTTTKFKKTKGKVWPLICYLSLITIVAALFLDSVSTILLMTPVVIRICEVTNLNPVPVLTIIIIAVNIGAIVSPIGDPPNIMIINNSYIEQSGLTFLEFIYYTFPGVFIILIQTFIQIRYFVFRDIKKLQNKEPLEISNIKHELRVWEETDRSISYISKYDDISRNVIETRINFLNEALQRKESHLHHQHLNQDHSNQEHPNQEHPNQEHPNQDHSNQEHPNQKHLNEEHLNQEQSNNVADLEKLYFIKDKPLLIKCGVTFAVVILLFLLHAAPHFENVSLGWASILGVILLLIISDNDGFKTSLLMVEWSSLLFFAALFIIMESLTKIGLIHFIGEKLSEVIKLVPDEYRLISAVILVLWVATIISALLDNIPLASMMIKIIVTLSSSLNLQIKPLVWALAFACGIGGNGTLIASSANLVCIGLAEQHGYKFKFMEFLKIGFPIMLVNAVLLSCYLIVLVVIQ